jgi:hypothetical protein
MIKGSWMLIAVSLCFMVLKAPDSVIGAEIKNDKISVSPEAQRDRKRYADEQTNIRQTSGKVVRNGKHLELQTRDHKVDFEDNDHNDEAYARYTFETYIKDKGYYLIRYSGYEWGGFFLINDRTGDKTELIDQPVFSPDRNSFITVSMDLCPHESINAIQIYRFNSEAPTLVFKEDFGEEWGPSDPVWLDNATIRFTKNTSDSPCSEIRSSKAFLVFKNNKWVLQDTLTSH